MLTGPFIDGAAVLIGGIAGSLLGRHLPERLRTTMPSIFGLASLGIGIILIGKVSNLPVMVLSTLLGTIIGELCYLEQGINKAASKAKNWMEHLKSGKKSQSSSADSFVQSFVAIVVLFCASGTGIFGAMREGMTGDPTILIAKAFLDFFTAIIFATTLGIAVAFISLPMVIIQLLLAYSAVAIMPLTSPTMMADFTSVGGLLLLGTGLRICGIKMFPVVNMLPALLISMPISALWSHIFL